MENNHTKEQKYILSLISYSLFNTKADIKNDDTLDYKYIFTKACEQKMETHVFDALNKLKINNILYEKLKPIYLKRISISAKQENEYLTISQIFKDNNINYIPLKGSFMKHYYPVMEHRIMGDIDIYYDEKRKSKLYQLLNNNGYKLDSTSDTHDVFTHGLYGVIELHHHLCRFGSKSSDFINSMSYSFLKDCKFSIEFNILFFLQHLAKHFQSGGAGFKSIIDIALYINKHSNEINKETLSQYLKACDYEKFFDTMISLNEYCLNIKIDYPHKIIDNEILDEIIDHIFKTGEFGHGKENDALSLSAATLMGNDNSKHTFTKKIKYVIKNVCLPYKVFKNRSKVIKYCPILLPFGWLLRLLKFIFTTPNRFKKRLQAISSVDTQSINSAKSLNEKIGLN